MVLNYLLEVDKLSYLIFASVYREYQTIKDFETAIHNLKSKS
jgi:transcriptional regulator NrdR family protein